MWVYYFRNDSGDEFLEVHHRELTVGEAIALFEWDDWLEWIREGYSVDDIPYQSFIKKYVEN